MRITVAQLNYHIGNFQKNVELMTDAIQKAKLENADLIIFSELSIPGYPPHDLLEHKDFIEKCEEATNAIALKCTGIAAIVGAPVVNQGNSGKKLFNSALLLKEGKVSEIINKSLLPTYDIFDEYRYFEPSTDFHLITLNGVRMAVTICEDLWNEQGFENEFSSSRMYQVSPMDRLAELNPDVIINISASPFSANRSEMKNRIFREKARKHSLPLFMSNQVGGNTELIFDGESLIIDPRGEIYDKLEAFRPDLRTYDLDDVKRGRALASNDGSTYISRIYDGLVLGIRDYFSKMRFMSATLGLSGGIDSAVTLAIATEALGSDRLRVLLMPSVYSSEHSVTDAVQLAEKLSIKYDIVNIGESFDSVKKSLKPLFDDLPEDVTEENIQARLRSTLLMAVSNKFGNILLNTSNKSEAAVGYGTLYGDMSGSLSVLGDVYKRDVFKLALYINRNVTVIPENSITKPPSAELRPDQKDTDSLPDYEILDSILYQYIELQKPASSITGEGITPALTTNVIRMINNNEYKRFQAPPVLRISSKAFGYGRRMPLVATF